MQIVDFLSFLLIAPSSFQLTKLPSTYYISFLFYLLFYYSFVLIFSILSCSIFIVLPLQFSLITYNFLFFFQSLSFVLSDNSSFFLNVFLSFLILFAKDDILFFFLICRKEKNILQNSLYFPSQIFFMIVTKICQGLEEFFEKSSNNL